MNPEIKIVKNEITNKIDNRIHPNSPAGKWERVKKGDTAHMFLASRDALEILKIAVAEVAELKSKIGRQTAALASTAKAAPAAPAAAPTATKPPATPLKGLAAAIALHKKH